MPGLQGKMGVWRSKLPGRAPVSHQDALHDMLVQEDARRVGALLLITIEIVGRFIGGASGEREYGAATVPSDGGRCSVASSDLHRPGHLRRLLHARLAGALSIGLGNSISLRQCCTVGPLTPSPAAIATFC